MVIALSVCSSAGAGVGRLAEDLVDAALDLRHLERLSGDLVQPDGGDQVLRPDEAQEMAAVQLGDEDALVAPEDLPQVGREGVQVAQMRLVDRQARVASSAHGR